MHIKRLMVKGLHPSICHDSQQQPETLPDFRGQETDFFCSKFTQGPSPPFHLFPPVSSSPSTPFKDFLCFISFQVLLCLCSPVSETASHRLTCVVFLSFLDGSSLHCSMLEVNVCCHRGANMFWHLIPDLSSTQMINLLSLASPQQVHFCKFRELVTSLHQHLSLYGHKVLRSAGWKARYWVEESSPGWGSAFSLCLFQPASLPTVLTGVPRLPKHCFAGDEAG